MLKERAAGHAARLAAAQKSAAHSAAPGRTALIAALADPSLRYFGSRAGDLVVVIDLSASMKAKGKSGSRFDAARREFLSLVDGSGVGAKNDGHRRRRAAAAADALQRRSSAACASWRATWTPPTRPGESKRRSISPTPFSNAAVRIEWW